MWPEQSAARLRSSEALASAAVKAGRSGLRMAVLAACTRLCLSLGNCLTMGPAMLRLTGEVADGWLGTSFVPEAAAAYLRYLDEGLAGAGRSRADLDVCRQFRFR